jgi:hypothetical protein
MTAKECHSTNFATFGWGSEQLKIDQRDSNRLNRSLTGSKGVGRLAVQFLADEMTIETGSAWLNRGKSKHSDLSLCQGAELSDNSAGWMPISSPAFPSRLKTPFEFFMATAIAVHGYSPKEDALFVSSAIRSAMGTALRGRKIIDEMERVFGS